MAEKILNTRIKLKYDTLTNWNATPGKDLILLKGEIGLCEIPASNAEATTAPTVLFKVGNGTSKFSELKWASAKAADVYDWAKAETAVLVGETLTFKTGDHVHGTVDLSAFATDDALNTLKEGLEADITALSGKVDKIVSADGLATEIADLDTRLDTIEGTGEGSIKKALTDAKTYAESEADTAESAAKSYTDGKVETINSEIAKLKTADGTLTTAINTEKTNRENADSAINAKIGGSYTSDNTVASAIADAKKAGTDAQTQITNLTNGAVKNNTDEIAQVKANLTAETNNRVAADNEFTTNLNSLKGRVDTFLADADLTANAVDTLKEIQAYISSDKTGSAELVTKVGNLETAVGDSNSGLVKQVADNDAAITALEGLTDTNGTIQTAIRTAQKDATQGITDAATAKTAADNAQTAADAAQGAVDSLNDTIIDPDTGLAAAHTELTTQAGRISALETASAKHATADAVNALTNRVKTAEDEIDALQNLTTGANGNAKLREDLTTLNTTVSGHTTSINSVTTKANTNATDISDLKTRVAAVEADYLKAADTYIFDCGGASE